ncbi:MAG TPA: hypothetical protein VGM77_03595 [Gemmatimonadales bacterium]|jgi:hypothetical protein
MTWRGWALAVMAASVAGACAPKERPTGPISMSIDTLVSLIRQDRYSSEVRGRRVTLHGSLDSAVSAWGRTTVYFRTGQTWDVECALTPSMPDLKAGDTLTVHAVNGDHAVKGLTLIGCAAGS